MTARINGNRREFVRGASAISGAAALTWLPNTRAATSLADFTAVQAVTAMRNGEMKAETYATALLDRQDALKGLNALIALDRDKVLEAARSADTRRMSGATLGAMHGLPISAKDSRSGSSTIRCAEAARRQILVPDRRRH